jgi:hypothetical protein
MTGAPWVSGPFRSSSWSKDVDPRWRPRRAEFREPLAVTRRTFRVPAALIILAYGLAKSLQQCDAAARAILSPILAPACP